MSPSAHVVASTMTSAAFFQATHSLDGTIACFLSGIFIDIDHHFDLWIYKKKFLWHLKELYHFCEKEKNGRMHLIFHSYELFAIFWVCLLIFHLSALWWGIAVGMTVHIILDQLYNPMKPGAYFLFYRIKNGFTKESLYPWEFYSSME